MKIGPKFKIAKRLGAPIFEKTQTQKFALSVARTGGNRQRRPGQMSDFKRQLLEKQKMRFTYGITEKQLRKYVNESVSQKQESPTQSLTRKLESRLDNVIYRMGLAKTRRLARQIVSHGHIVVNGKRSTIPSQEVKVNDVITIREGSKDSALFVDLASNFEASALPSWANFDPKALTGKVTAKPNVDASETLFDTDQVMEFYSR